MTKKSIAATIGFGLGAAAVLARRARRPDICGQSVLITGGSSGLGFALARELGRQGCRIAICARDEEQLATAAHKLRQESVEVYAIPCDVSDATQVHALVDKVQRQLGQIDILINNAGEILVAPLENTTRADFERALDVMFWGVVNATLAVLPEMRLRGGGRIAIVTSIGGKVSVPHLLAYSCAKSAAVAFGEGLRAELSGTGIQVSTIVPGLMRTGSHVNARFKGDQSSESAWFSVAASAPLLAISANRAARQIVRAIGSGKAIAVLSPAANLLVRTQGMLPGLVPHLFGFANRFLPAARPASQTHQNGLALTRRHGFLLKTLTVFGRRAGKQLNQAV